MKKLITAIASISFLVGTASADVDSDQKAFINYFKTAFPNVEFADYTNGVYSLDEGSRAQFEEILDGIPPYEEAVEKGGEEFVKFGLNKCAAFKDPAAARVKHPYFDEATQKVVTLEAALKACYQEQTGKKLGSKKGKIARISAWISDQAAGEKINVKVEGAAAQAAYGFLTKQQVKKLMLRLKVLLHKRHTLKVRHFSTVSVDSSTCRVQIAMCTTQVKKHVLTSCLLL